MRWFFQTLAYVWLSGALLLSGLWMMDEIQTEIRFTSGCTRIIGSFCGYTLPIFGTIDTYNAESLGWFLVFLGVFFLFAAFILIWRHRNDFKM